MVIRPGYLGGCPACGSSCARTRSVRWARSRPPRRWRPAGPVTRSSGGRRVRRAAGSSRRSPPGGVSRSRTRSWMGAWLRWRPQRTGWRSRYRGSRAGGPIPSEATSAAWAWRYRPCSRSTGRGRCGSTWSATTCTTAGPGSVRRSVRSPDGIDLVGVVPAAERDRPLLGLRGITSLRGREFGEDPARLLAIDAGLAELAASWGVAGSAGRRSLRWGRAGGPRAGWAAGHRAGRHAGGRGGSGRLVVTGCTSYDFASRGGGVVASAAQLAERLLCPCVVLAGRGADRRA